MIVMSITRYKHPPPPKRKGKTYESKPKLVVGSDEHKKFLITKSIENAIAAGFDFGDEFKAKGMGEKVGILINIEDKIETIEWDGLKVCNLELFFNHDNSFRMFHTSDIRKVK